MIMLDDIDHGDLENQSNNPPIPTSSYSYLGYSFLAGLSSLTGALV